MAEITKGKIDQFRPATENANDHTARGLRELERSMQENGYVTPITVAADGEALDGSARLEASADKFGDDVIVVHHDGTKPIVMVRDDIPDARTPRAKQIALAANRVAELDLSWNTDQLVQDAKIVKVKGLWTDKEFKELTAMTLEDLGYQDPRKRTPKCNAIVCPNCGHVITGEDND